MNIDELENELRGLLAEDGDIRPERLVPLGQAPVVLLSNARTSRRRVWVSAIGVAAAVAAVTIGIVLTRETSDRKVRVTPQASTTTTSSAAESTTTTTTSTTSVATVPAVPPVSPNSVASNLPSSSTSSKPTTAAAPETTGLRTHYLEVREGAIAIVRRSDSAARTFLLPADLTHLLSGTATNIGIIGMPEHGTVDLMYQGTCGAGITTRGGVFRFDIATGGFTNLTPQSRSDVLYSVIPTEHHRWILTQLACGLRTGGAVDTVTGTSYHVSASGTLNDGTQARIAARFDANGNVIATVGIQDGNTGAPMC